MLDKSISFIIATTGRPSLQRTLASITTRPGDEVLVIQHTPPSGNWGNAERQEGTDRAQCDYLAFIDDDDVYVPNHREIMATAILESQQRYPIMFRMQYPNGRLLWEEKKLKCGNVGLPMMLVPNDKEKLSRWKQNISAADYKFMDNWHWPRRLIIWREEVIAMLGHNDEKYENGWDYTQWKQHTV